MEKWNNDPVLSVVIALIRRESNVLIARRPLHVEHGGDWEFPGGKCHENESLAQAIIRECNEELGIDVQSPEFFMDLVHTYSHRRVHLTAFTVWQFSGEPQPLASLECQWVPINTLLQYYFPEANAPIVKAMMHE